MQTESGDRAATQGPPEKKAQRGRNRIIRGYSGWTKDSPIRLVECNYY